MAKRARKRKLEFHDDPNNSLGHLVRRTSRAFGRALQARLDRKGVTLGQFRFLRVLWVEDGITQRELSQRVGLKEPSTVAALRGMEEDGLVTRTKSDVDRRRIHVRLTQRARRLRKPLMEYVKDVNRISLRGFTPEDIDIGRRLLLLAISNLQADSGNSPELLEEHLD